MRLTNVFGGRPAFYDRNPTQISNTNFTITTGPHAATTRWTYTVPAARKAMITGYQVQNIRITAAGTAGMVNTAIGTYPGGVVNATIAEPTFVTNNIGDGKQMNGGQATMLVATDVVKGLSVDASTTGTVYHDTEASLMEFDA